MFKGLATVCSALALLGMTNGAAAQGRYWGGYGGHGGGHWHGGGFGWGHQVHPSYGGWYNGLGYAFPGYGYASSGYGYGYGPYDYGYGGYGGYGYGGCVLQPRLAWSGWGYQRVLVRVCY